jgi:predicted lipoprotein with Yx(FWY)xxD motif
MLTLPSYGLRRQLLSWSAALLIIGLTLGISSCNDSDNQNITPIPTIQLDTKTTLGAHLVDKQGNTIYYFARDLDGTNHCAGSCAVIWPVFYEPNLVLGEGLKAEDFAVITTGDGQPQNTYKGWPMYYYAPIDANGQSVREKAGEVLGENVGNVWFVMKPDYALQVARTSVVNKTSNQSVLKSFLIDNQGRTLYIFGRDQISPATQATNCAGNCIATGPVYLETGRNLPSNLTSSDFGVITRPDGPNNTPRQQTTYKGMPLYYYTPDEAKRNKVEGDGIGNIWAVATL